jgi:tetratricopeptide (TPR) repeat protein
MVQKRKRPQSPEAGDGDDDPGLFSPMVVERAMAELSRALSGQSFKSTEEADAYINKLLDEGGARKASAPRTLLERAQEIMYLAWEESELHDRIALAESAVEISADCADAFTLLGDEKAFSANEARAYYEEAVRAGARAIGEKAFDKDVGHFWGILQTRPYMRARVRLAICLWDIGDKRSAVAHLEELLRLNPGDNQGNRYLLLGFLIQLRDDAAVEKLLAANPDESGTGWMYDKALWLIQRHAPVAEISLGLDDALETNHFVPMFLLGRKRVPREMADYLTWGGEDEAGAYCMEAKPRWVKTPGALAHVRKAVARSKKSGMRESRM